MYLHVLLFLSWLLLPQPTLVISTTPNYTANVAAVTNSTFFIAKNGSCSLTCGSLTVPYPFGIGVGSGCSIDRGFDITCDNSSGPPKAFIGTGNVEILSISQNQVRIRSRVARACYNEAGALTKPLPAWVNLGDPGAYPYTISDVVNKFTVVGCDDYGWILGIFGGKNLISGCTSQCGNRKDVGDETGYCQTNIPKELTKYNITLRSFNNHTTGQLEEANKKQAVGAKVAERIAKHKEELDQVDSSAYQAGQKKAAKYYATGQGLDAAQVPRDALIRQIPEAPIPDVPISPSAEEEPTEESIEHVEDESKPPAAT
ncbi:hypothetical protein Vadar_009216 [Vaccinium darrowii]|uniref:Uncharacterized protein n=1 Tax=Vaccinium darrowii TaxID=229202 RepID=A0ACB7XPC0_9ERIC|nr:hypothetical protein Vadar_009216 [Vaccinium darrowii]